jgi:putative ABC transport system ATP-binding protein
VIAIQHVSKRYRSGRRAIPALLDVSLHVEHGEWVAIVGPSGCGKSTLLNIMSGIDTADEGDVTVAGTRLNGLSEGALAAWRGREIGIVFQFFQLMPTLTVRENVILPMELAGNARHKRERAERLIASVGLAALADNLPSELSGGEQQRVAVARALANAPGLLLADEPTGNLDSANGAAVIDLFQDVWQAGGTIVMVTHDAEIAARASRVVTMRDGHIITDERQAPPYSLAGAVGRDAYPPT